MMKLKLLHYHYGSRCDATIKLEEERQLSRFIIKGTRIKITEVMAACFRILLKKVTFHLVEENIHRHRSEFAFYPCWNWLEWHFPVKVLWLLVVQRLNVFTYVDKEKRIAIPSSVVLYLMRSLLGTLLISIRYILYILGFNKFDFKKRSRKGKGRFMCFICLYLSCITHTYNKHRIRRMATLTGCTPLCRHWLQNWAMGNLL
jgi:hypothetical protein